MAAQDRGVGIELHAFQHETHGLKRPGTNQGRDNGERAGGKPVRGVRIVGLHQFPFPLPLPSEQYETEQRRHSGQIGALREQVEALQRQVERLSARVTDLTGYSGTYGAGPGSRWR